MAVQGRDRDGISEPEAVELERLCVTSRIVELVREHEHGSSRAAEDLCELLVSRSHPSPRVDHEEHEVRLFHRLPCLGRYLRPERPCVREVDASGVDEPELRPRPLAQELLAVAGDSGRLVDDRRARLAQSVDERRLAHVRVADDRDRSGELAHRSASVDR